MKKDDVIKKCTIDQPSKSNPKYNDLTTSLRVNNFVTTFKYIEESDNIGDENYIQNTTSYRINESSSLLFPTRRNKRKSSYKSFP